MEYLLAVKIMTETEIAFNYLTEGKYAEAAEVFRTLTLADHLEPFLTVPAYEHYFSK